MAANTPLKIQQAEKYEGDDWWRWSVWVDGPQPLMDNIDHVEYTLHPTFRDPVRTITSRENGFKLDTEGWGVFPIFARVQTKDGKVIRLKHNLKLSYPDSKLNLK